MEDLAIRSGDNARLVTQVYDQYLNYVCLESTLFSLRLPGVYVTLNDPATPERVIEHLIDQIASGLFAVAVTLEAVPIIRCPRGNVAEAVALKLESKFRDNMMNSRSNLFPVKPQANRPGSFNVT